MTKPLVHIVNLDTVGGVEHLFAHFLTSSKGTHYVVVPGKKPHAHFKKSLKNAHATLLERYLLGCKLPKRVGLYRRKKLLKTLSQPHVVYWNRMEKANIPGCFTTYYEHGASWMGKVSSDKLQFLQSVDNAIAISHAAAQMLRLRWAFTRPITIIPNPRRPDISIATAPKKLDVTKPLRLGFIGRLTPLKGAPIALHISSELLKRGVPVELYIAGEGEDESTLRALSDKLKVKTHFTRFISNVSAWYDSIDLLVVPSIREPLGLISLEAAARGVPVIATAVDGLPEVVKHGISGITIEPTLEIEDYLLMGGIAKNLPEVVYDPIKQRITHPKILNPSVAAADIEALLPQYEQFSAQALIQAKAHPTFDDYVHTLTNHLLLKSQSL